VNKLDILQRCRLYLEASEGLRGEIERAATMVRLPVGERLFEQGGPCKQFAILGSGRLRVHASNRTGREISLYRVRPGEACPINMLCVILGTEAPATSEAERDAEAVTCSGTMFRYWVNHHEAVRQFVFEEMRARFVTVTTLLQNVAFGTLEQRLAQFLRARFAISESRPPRMVVTHEQLADELATAREVVSRLLKEFEHLGAIELQRGRIVLRDQATLELLAGLADPTASPRPRER
jgi:CRP/FNR family transcriptional regulator, anaerobic regulatory protein